MSLERVRAAVAAMGMLISGTASADAACTSWDVTGRWTLHQTNGFSITLDLVHKAGAVTGTATHVVSTRDCVKTATCQKRTVSADGSVEGNAFVLTAYWSAGSIGVYEGQIGAQGRIEGTTFDKRRPSSRAQWHSDRLARCRSAR